MFIEFIEEFIEELIQNTTDHLGKWSVEGSINN